MRSAIANGGLPATLLIDDPRDTLGRAPSRTCAMLEHQLSRATRRRVPAAGATRTLFALFGHEATGELPAGAVTMFADSGAPPSGYWLRADPVQLDVAARMVIRQQGGFRLDSGEHAALTGALAEYFQGEDLEFLAPAPDRWYLHRDQPFELSTAPLDELEHADLGNALPEGPPADRWRRRLNEIQILLHNHPVTAGRRTAGVPAANSLWFWGAGALPAPSRPAFSEILGDHPVASALQKLSGAGDGGALLVARGDCASLWERWEELSASGRWRVLVPLWGLDFRQDALGRLRFWRRRRRLEELLAGGPP